MTECQINGCELITLQVKGDDRGNLVAIERGNGLPFDIQRVYYVFGTKPGVNRGFHAHHILRQLLVAVSGSCVITVDDVTSGTIATRIRFSE